MNIRLLILLSLLSPPSYAHEYSGDGIYSITTDDGPLWFNLYTHALTLPEIPLNSESKRIYKIRDYCSKNHGFIISLLMNSPKKERWWENSTTVNLTLTDPEGRVITQRNGPLNGYNLKANKSTCKVITYQACPPETGQWTADYVVRGRYGNGSAIAVLEDGILTKSFTQNIISEESLSCGEYSLSVEIKNPYLGSGAIGHIEILSGWK